MIIVEQTPNNAGVRVIGDAIDFERLYDAFHEVVGEDGEYVSHISTRLRVLGVCYDLRHALMGDREITLVPNGMHKEVKRSLGILAPEENVYMAINVLWPEMLFVMMALNDFVLLYSRKKGNSYVDIMLDRNIIWNESVAMVRLFQSAVLRCIADLFPVATVSRIKNLMIRDYTTSVDNYTTQYVDILNCRFLDLDKDERKKNISRNAKRLSERGSEYLGVEAEVHAAARHYGTTPDNIRFPGEYPEEIDW